MSLCACFGTGSDCAGWNAVTSIRVSQVADSNRNSPDPWFCLRVNVARRKILRKIEKSSKQLSVNLLWTREDHRAVVVHTAERA